MRAFWRRRPAPAWLPQPPAADAPQHLAFDGHAAFLAEFERGRARFDAQWRLQNEVPAAVDESGWPGWCGLCSRPVAFELPGGGDLREGLHCPGCRLNARNRAAMALLCHALPLDRAQVYLTEQVSDAYLWLQALCPGLHGSEYGLDAATRTRLQQNFQARGGRGELAERDVTRLDFAPGSLDAIGSYDVLEHVPAYAAALREFARCLKPGGRLVLTAPFGQTLERTLVRAVHRADGSIEHLQPPEMHGDPVRGGVLCYYHFGWDLLDAAREAGFAQAHWVRTWSPREGLFALWTLVAIR